MVTAGEKWITYGNIQRNWRSVGANSLPAAIVGPKDSIVCLVAKEIVHYEPLPYCQTFKSFIGSEQSPTNPTPDHTSLVTLQKSRKLGWEVLKHPPYSPDLAQNNCYHYLFLSMANDMAGEELIARNMNWMILTMMNLM